MPGTNTRAIRHDRTAFTLVELLTVIAIIAILSALTYPALQAARNVARKAQCSSNIRQLALALQSHYTIKQRFPMGCYGRDPSLIGMSITEAAAGDRAGHGAGWTSYILPHLEEKGMFLDLNLQLQPDGTGQWSAGNLDETQKLIGIFRCPSEIAPSSVNDISMPNRVTCNYLGCAGSNQDPTIVGLNGRTLDRDDLKTSGTYRQTAYDGIYPDDLSTPAVDESTYAANGMLFNRSRINANDVPDGFSHTILVGEAIFAYGTDSSGTSYFNDHWAIGSRDIDSGLDVSEFLGSTAVPFNQNFESSFGSWHAGNVTNFAFADGSTHTLDDEIDPMVRRRLGQRNDGATIEADSF